MNFRSGLPVVLAIGLVVTLLPGPRAAAQSSAPTDQTVPVLQAERTLARPVIDGRIDEAVWETAGMATDFTQLTPNPGRPATQRTEVRVLYDDDAIYVAARMYDTAPDSIVGQLARRDNEVHSDWFYVGIDSYFDRRTAFLFAVNPVGVKLDALLHNDTESDQSWDAVWEAAATRDEAGWSAEFRIPLSQLRFSPDREGRGQVWGINFLREIARNGEESLWAPILPDVNRVVSVFGELRGLSGLPSPRRLEVVPYAVTRATRAPGESGDPFHRTIDAFASGGADLKAGITSDITLTATINPDFGQVEADPAVVSLSPGEVFFSERRPFFVEGVDIFRFGLGLGDGDLGNESLFYSRRIGRAPQGGVHGEFTSLPDHATILAAAKLSGKTATGWSLGFLDALTAAEHGRYHSAGEGGETPVEPLTNYAVARVIRDFRSGNSAIGGIGTATNRRLPASGDLDWLNRAAYTGGIDVRHRFMGGAYQVTASLVGSHIAGSADAMDRVQRSPVRYFQRPDADHLDYDPARTSLQGLAARAEVSKLQGHWRFSGFGLAISPGFEANDLGFQANADLALAGYWAGYQQYEPGRIFRSWNVGTIAWTGTNFGGERVARGGNVHGNFQLHDFWGAGMGIEVSGEALSHSMLRGGPSFLRPVNWSFWSNAYTDRRRPVQLSIHVNGARSPEVGGRRINVSPGVLVRPAHNLDVTVSPSFGVNRDPLQYVATRQTDGSARYILGTVDQTTVGLTTRLNYTISPSLSVQFYAQPFVSAGDYASFKLVADPRAARIADRVRVLTPDQITDLGGDDRLVWEVDLDGDGAGDFRFDDPSFTFRQLRSNLVLRWEYRPGSTIFVVWGQGRTGFDADGSFRLGDDLGELWRAEGTHTLLIKASYWLGL
jgi:hypothetical protein